MMFSLVVTDESRFALLAKKQAFACLFASLSPIRHRGLREAVLGGHQSFPNGKAGQDNTVVNAHFLHDSILMAFDGSF